MCRPMKFSVATPNRTWNAPVANPIVPSDCTSTRRSDAAKAKARKRSVWFDRGEAGKSSMQERLVEGGPIVLGKRLRRG